MKKYIQKQIQSLKFSSAYEELCKLNYSFSYKNLICDFPKIEATIMYLFLMYSISQNEDKDKHIATCYYLYFENPHIEGADALIKWHLIQAMKNSPFDKDILQNWIFGIYNGNPDNPFTESELHEYGQMLDTIREQFSD